MERIITKDGSVTYRSEKYDETYHSVTGAVEEAFKKFIGPCPVDEYALHGEVRVLDVCFGLGYNSSAAIDKIREANPDARIVVVGLENDTEIMRKVSGLSPPMKSYRIIQRMVHDHYYYADKRIRVKVLLGDARQTLPSVRECFDIILHDPFSPKKCPELWTLEFFSELRKHINPGGVLTTYSCARIVRDNLRKAGFSVEDGPCVGRRAPSTVARPVCAQNNISGQ
jgi:tRNA U34 5-methylaminomethyl-2-thiouridine-forming methyltransferase MnmC